jgi:hypothetical protein
MLMLQMKIWYKYIAISNKNSLETDDIELLFSLYLIQRNIRMPWCNTKYYTTQASISMTSGCLIGIKLYNDFLNNLLSY